MRTEIAFWDTSAIIPLVCSQEFSARARRLRQSFKIPIIWWGTPVEVYSGIDRLNREEMLTGGELRDATLKWRQLYVRARKVKPDEKILELAVGIPALHNLRALDAFQLAAALRWCDERPRNRPFVSADSRLSEAANDAGFNVVSLV